MWIKKLLCRWCRERSNVLRLKQGEKINGYCNIHVDMWGRALSGSGADTKRR